jgi:hypothetical protein
MKLKSIGRDSYLFPSNFFLAYYFTLNMEEIYSSEMLIDFQKATRVMPMNFWFNISDIFLNRLNNY